MANVPKAITDLPVASAMGDDDLLVVSQNATTSSIKGELIKGYAQNAVASQVTAAQTAANQAGDAKTDAETARNEAETSASSAANSAADAESAATEAGQAKTYIENMNMEGETLPAGSSVTVTKTTSPEGNLLFVIGVPQGIQGDKGDTGETGATGPQGVSITNATVNEDGDLVITLSSGSPINAGSVIGPQGIQGEVGPTGASVDHIDRTSGTGAPGTTDTYTVYLTDGQTGGTFQVYNGSNGTGSGDFMADGSVPMTGDLQMGGHAVTGMADGTESTDGATVGQLAGKLDSPDGGTAGQVLTKTADGSAWEDAPSGLPDGGTEGQMLYKAADGAAWGDTPVMYVTVTQSSDGSGHKVDKDAGEIKAAYEAGSSVFLVWDRNDLGKDDWQVIQLSAMDISANGNHYARFLNLRYSAVVDVDGDVDITEVVFTSSEITYNNSNSGLTSTNAQDAINEVQENVENVLPSGGTTGQVLTKTSTGEEWSDAPSGLPEGGTEGQILEKTSSGAAWVDKPESGLTQEQADDRYLQLSGGTLTGALTLNGEPTEDLQAAPKQYVDALKPLARTITLTTSGWSSTTGGYQQVVSVSGVTTDPDQIIWVDVSQSGTDLAADKALSEAWGAGPGQLTPVQQSGSLKFLSVEKPTVNIPVNVVVSG